jgi:hypothetical protein
MGIIAEIPRITLAVLATIPIIEGGATRIAIQRSGYVPLAGAVTAGTRAINIRACGRARPIAEEDLAGWTCTRAVHTGLAGGAAPAAVALCNTAAGACLVAGGAGKAAGTIRAGRGAVGGCGTGVPTGATIRGVRRRVHARLPAEGLCAVRFWATLIAQALAMRRITGTLVGRRGVRAKHLRAELTTGTIPSRSVHLPRYQRGKEAARDTSHHRLEVLAT